MRDYMREMLNAHAHKGDQAAFDLGVKLRDEIDEEFKRLSDQRDAINHLGSWLQEWGDVDQGSSPVPAENRIDPLGRPKAIVTAALQVMSRGTGLKVTTQDVYWELQSTGVDLGVEQPKAVIGTVLSKHESFKKLARNTFEFIPPTPKTR